MCLILQISAVGIVRSRRTDKWQVQYESNNKVNTKIQSSLFRENKREGFLDKVASELNFERRLDYCSFLNTLSTPVAPLWLQSAIFSPPSHTKRPSPITYQKREKFHIYEELQNLASARFFFNFIYLFPHQTALSLYHWVSSSLLSINIYRAPFQPNPNLLKTSFVYLSLGCTLPLPTNWLLLTSTAHYPNSSLA